MSGQKFLFPICFVLGSISYPKKILENFCCVYFGQKTGGVPTFSVGYKTESNNANDSKKEDLSQLFVMRPCKHPHQPQSHSVELIFLHGLKIYLD